MASKALPAPTIEYLTDLRRETQREFQQQDTDLARLRRVRMMQEPVPIEDKYRLVQIEVRDPAIADEAQRIQATLSLNRATLACTPPKGLGASDSADANATLREHWTEKTLWASGTRTPGQDTYRDVVDAAANDGGAWCKLLWAPDLWDAGYDAGKQGKEAEAEDAKKAAGPPFYWLHVDTLSVYPVWHGRTLGEVLEVTERPLNQTLRQYRLRQDPGTGELRPDELGQPMPENRHGLSQASGLPAETATVIEHWDATWCTWAVVAINAAQGQSGVIVKQFRHKYGRVPYFYAPGLTMNWFKARKVGWSVSETKRWLVEYRSYLRTLHAQYVARDLLSPLFRQVPDGAAALTGEDGAPLEREPGPQPGMIVNGHPGEVIQRIDYPTAESLEKHMALVDMAIERLESPRVTQLGGLEGAGFAVSQVLSEARIRFEPISANIEQMLGEVTHFLWSLVRERVKETVWVAHAGRVGGANGWLGAGPDDLTDTVGVEWEVSPERATDDLIKARYATERLTNGTWGKDEAVSYLGDNPDEIRRSQARDRIRSSPWYQQQQDLLVAQAAGRGDLIARAQQAMAAATEGAVPGAGGANPMGDMLARTGATPDFAGLATAPNAAGALPSPLGNDSAAGQPTAPTQSVAGGIQRLNG